MTNGYFECDCGYSKNTKAEYVGKKGKCPKCGNIAWITEKPTNTSASADEKDDSLLQPSPPQQKNCPYCDELISVNAIKCKHCGSFLNETTHLRPAIFQNTDLFLLVLGYIGLASFVVGSVSPFLSIPIVGSKSYVGMGGGIEIAIITVLGLLFLLFRRVKALLIVSILCFLDIGLALYKVNENISKYKRELEGNVFAEGFAAMVDYGFGLGLMIVGAVILLSPTLLHFYFTKKTLAENYNHIINN